MQSAASREKVPFSEPASGHFWSQKLHIDAPLPLVGYGGTSMVTLPAGFVRLMSIQTHRKRLPPLESP